MDVMNQKLLDEINSLKNEHNIVIDSLSSFKQHNETLEVELNKERNNRNLLKQD